MKGLHVDFSRAFEARDKTAATFARAHATIEAAAEQLGHLDPARRAVMIGARQTGRTARHLAYLLDLAAEGQKILFLSCSPAAARHAHRLAADLAGRRAKVFTRQITLGDGGIWFRCLGDSPSAVINGMFNRLDRLAADHAADLGGSANADGWQILFEHSGIPRA